MWLCSVRAVISNSFRCRKSKSGRFCQPIIIESPSSKERLLDYSTLTSAKKFMLIKETLKDRSIKRNTTEISKFIDEWPFLTTQEGLRMEFKSMSGKKNLDYIVARIRRAFPSKKL